MTSVRWRACLALTWTALTWAALSGAAWAQATPAREAFEKYGLLGTFAPDCSKPVSGANGYIVYRAIDPQRVQRDTMTSPTTRLFVSVAETAALNALNEITIEGIADGKPLSYTLRVDGRRHRVMQWTEGGVQSVTAGVWVERKYTMPWVTKCS